MVGTFLPLTITFVSLEKCQIANVDWKNQHGKPSRIEIPNSFPIQVMDQSVIPHD